MRYKTLELLYFTKKEGELKVKEGDIVELPERIARELLQLNKIRPLSAGEVERYAVRIYSELLNGYLWVVETDKDMHYVRSQGVTEAIYSHEEVRKLRGLCKDSIKEIHKVKELFKDSKIEDIKLKEGKRQCD